jgi:hypothetical protein
MVNPLVKRADLPGRNRCVTWLAGFLAADHPKIDPITPAPTMSIFTLFFRL